MNCSTKISSYTILKIFETTLQADSTMNSISVREMLRRELKSNILKINMILSLKRMFDESNARPVKSYSPSMSKL